ncbi:hypothetical protein U8P73_36085 (plasmid) [Rhizobium beringeri]|uniref:hypothetical protein n=1 Tax=Rhizobium beringeri TaxID=3019934 RepID=UPI002DDD0173|nr:hypothetical protein [Rhizobium beringeri]WSG93570.1 hypothetical protein U8P73_36085 [Rhizobium beringeri]
MSKFPKDKWIMAAIRSRYLIPNEDGTIKRANKADAKGVVDPSRGYSLVTVQVHKKSGRVYFNMTFMGFTKSVLVNRVIALAFLPNPNDLPQVNHIDGDKEHNYLRQPTPELRAKWGEFQLEWSSGSDNEKHAHRTGLKTGRGSANSNAKLTAPEVIEIRASKLSVPELVAKHHVSRSTIINILKNVTWRHV